MTDAQKQPENKEVKTQVIPQQINLPANRATLRGYDLNGSTVPVKIPLPTNNTNYKSLIPTPKK